MTLEEQKQFEELQQLLEKEKSKVSDQNKYITKLEAKQQENNQQPKQQQTNVYENNINKYIMDKMRFDLTTKAKIELKKSSFITDEILASIEKDVVEFLDKAADAANLEINFILSAFHLCLGKALATPEHDIHKVLLNKPIQNPTPYNQQQQRIDAFKQVLSPAPNMVPTDPSFKPASEHRINSTKEALNGLAARLKEGSTFK